MTIRATRLASSDDAARVDAPRNSASTPRVTQSSPYRVLSLFSGIGGFELGLERTKGFVTVAQCEIDPFCRRVLEKHWPHVKRYEDVRELTAERLAADGIGVDVICGGFPCQDISSAGSRLGVRSGERSGLWSEYARLIGEIRPVFAVVENVAGLLSGDLGEVLGDLAALGYDAQWHCIPAAAVGAPHRRDRVWIVAYPGDGTLAERSRSTRRQSGERAAERRLAGRAGPSRAPTDTHNEGEHAFALYAEMGGASQLAAGSRWRLAESPVCRGDDGLPYRVDRLAALGNAVVPQIPELIGRAILASEGRA